MTYSAEVLADSPAAYWRLGDASGTTMTDSSGNGRNSTYTGTPTLGVTGALVGDTDTAITLNGSSQYGSQGWAVWQNVTSVSLEAWIKTTATSIKSIIDRDNIGASARVFQFRHNATGKLEFLRIVNAAGTTAVVTATGTVSINDGNWHHVVLTYDASSALLYVDGALDTTTAISGGLRQPGSTTALSVGVNFSSGPGSQFFAGSIDEAAYYGSVLSAARITAHYNAGIGAGGPTPLTGTWGLVA